MSELTAMAHRNAELADALRAICKRFDVDTNMSAEDAAKKVLKALERDWMRLPVDADGMPWYIGDEVQREDKNKPNVVTGIYFYNDGNHMLQVRESNCTAWTPPARKCRHVQPDTVESLLADFQQDTLTSQGEYAGEVIEADEWQRELERLVGDYAERIRKAVDR